ncbi:MAG: hypothetical protein V4649_00470 [Bacteroidota bacterium]
MKKNQGNIADDLLVKYLLGEATAGEQQQVQEWIKESRENKNHYDQLKLLWNQSKKVAPAITVTTEEAWERFKLRTRQPQPLQAPVAIGKRSFTWLRVAAVLLLLAGSGIAVWMANRQSASPQQQMAQAQPAAITPATAKTAAPAPDSITKTATAAMNMQQRSINTTYISGPKNAAAKRDTKTAAVKTTKTPAHDYVDEVRNYYRTHDFVCNGTPCPLEICIVQAIKCPGAKTSAVATCSTLLPDQSGQLKYKALDKVAENCMVTIQEIRIKRVTTGETIVLNEHSKPSTAEDLFNYITGQKKGDILAGVFYSDCNNNDREHSLKIDNSFGGLVIQ